MVISNVKTSCLDWEKRLIAGEGIIPPPQYPGRASHAWDVFGSLRMADVLGQPCFKDAAKPWLESFVKAVFGNYDKKTGKQLIEEFFLLIAKKNAKSTTAAGIMLTALILNQRSSAEFVVIAPTMEIAKNSFGPAKDMVRTNPYLSKLFKIQEHLRTITHLKTGAKLAIIAADARSLGGKKATGILVDELWLFGERHDADNILREAVGGLASRPEGFVIYLSTQSANPPAGIFKDKLQYARDVRDGKVNDPAFLPILYEYPESCIKNKLYLDCKYLHVSNPNIGASVRIPFLEKGIKRLEHDSPAAKATFLSKHLNIEMRTSVMSDSWLPLDDWLACAKDNYTLDELLERCETVAVGIDGGGVFDLLAACALGRTAKGEWLCYAAAWCSETLFKKNTTTASLLRGFTKEGLLAVMDPLEQDDTRVMADFVVKVEQSGKLCKIGIDPRGVHNILTALTNAGISQELITYVSQGWQLSPTIECVERCIDKRKLCHNNNSLLNWSIGNAVVKMKDGQKMMEKGDYAHKIDPVMALLDAAYCLELFGVSEAPQAFLWKL